MSAPFLLGIAPKTAPLGQSPRDRYLSDLMGEPLRLAAPVSILVGANGSGKSTLLTAIADHMGLNSAGGSHANRFGDEPPGSSHRALRFSWRRKIKNGFFFRADRLQQFNAYLDALKSDPEPRVAGPSRAFWGERSNATRSHGEGILDILDRRLGSESEAIYLLDEPEAALSPLRQLDLVLRMEEWAETGAIQIILATHSPILMSCPGAQVLEFGAAGLTEKPFDETEHYRVMRDFVLGHERARGRL